MDRPFLNRPVDFIPEYHGQQPCGSPINIDNFYKRRRGEIRRKLTYLRTLSDQDLAQLVSSSLTAHWGEKLYGMNWDKLDPYFVISVAWSLGGNRLAIILDEMLRDPVCYSRGMPDLLFCQAMPLVSTKNNEVRGESRKSSRGCRCCPWNSSTCGTGGGVVQHNMKCFVSEVKRYIVVLMF
jgi:hypothetical protein